MTQEDQINDINNKKQVQDNEEVVEENKTFSTVSIASGQKKLLLVVLVLLVAGVIYYFFFEDNGSKTNDKPEVVDKKEKEKMLKSSKPVPKYDQDTELSNGAKDSKPLSAPEVVAPTPTPPPPPPPPPPKIDIPQKPVLPLPPSLSGDNGDSSSSRSIFHSPFSDDSDEEKKRQMAIEAKKKAGIMVSGGGGSDSGGLLAGGKKEATPPKKNSSDFLGFGDGALDGEAISNSKAVTVKATEVNNLNRTIIQGKIVNAVLETAINTDIPGMLRAIVTRDVYAEQGIDIMIPKGSRLIGSYESEVKGGQTRVAVMWNRLIRPDGIDIEIGSAGVDQLGRTGIAGDVYDHFWSKIGNAFLVSYVVPVVAAEVAKKASNIKNNNNSQSSSTTNKDGSITITTSGDPTAQAIADSTKQFSDITKGMLQDSFSTKPTITVNQGTVISILVQKDLVFPPLNYIQNKKINK
ncbi:TrbI/VirB10 family protein [Candidatus Bandiella numerosa]|uniref:TrbI/VirB10 family protein n=1 Tax=Candidatus Bandiella numerosa TaxID=2570586 RepID=UPI00249E75C9|nr:TrbI/VirB10 family protein [Candidatus Bandiella numerosa]WHA04758.1 TrbI/VirB10 family protein [Candidatus Bandiella numerosa]